MISRSSSRPTSSAHRSISSVGSEAAASWLTSQPWSFRYGPARSRIAPRQGLTPGWRSRSWFAVSSSMAVPMVRCTVSTRHLTGSAASVWRNWWSFRLTRCSICPTADLTDPSSRARAVWVFGSIRATRLQKTAWCFSGCWDTHSCRTCWALWGGPVISWRGVASAVSQVSFRSSEDRTASIRSPRVQASVSASPHSTISRSGFSVCEVVGASWEVCRLGCGSCHFFLTLQERCGRIPF